MFRERHIPNWPGGPSYLPALTYRAARRISAVLKGRWAFYGRYMIGELKKRLYNAGGIKIGHLWLGCA